MLTFLSNSKVWVITAIAALGMFTNSPVRAAPTGGGGPTLDPIIMLMVEQAVGAVVRDWVEGGVTPPTPGELGSDRIVNSTCAPGICTATVSATVEGFAGTVDYDIAVVSGTNADTALIFTVVECNFPDIPSTLPPLCPESACQAITLEGVLKGTNLIPLQNFGQSDRHTMATVVGEEVPGEGQSDCIPRLGGGQLFGESDTFGRPNFFRGRDITLGEGHSVNTVAGTLAGKAFAQYIQDMKRSTGEISKTATECTVTDGDVSCDVTDECSGPVSFDDASDSYTTELACETSCFNCEGQGCPECE